MSKEKSYMGLGPCGKAVGAVLDMAHQREDTAEFVADLIKEGFGVIRTSPEAVRATEWCTRGGKCKKCEFKPEEK